jgi:Zn-dependent protease
MLVRARYCDFGTPSPRGRGQTQCRRRRIDSRLLQALVATIRQTHETNPPRSSNVLVEPGPTQADLHFRLFGFPVRIHPMFWVVALLFGQPWAPDETVTTLSSWMLVVFLSILVHEFGHAVLMRYFGFSARIVLYASGGLAIPEMGYRDSYGTGAGYGREYKVGWPQIVISLAGPAAGFLFAAAIVSILYAVGARFAFYFFYYIVEVGRGNPITNEALWRMLTNLMRVNIFWGLMNLLPLYPLDGGQISRELFLLYGNPNTAIRHSLILSVATGATVAVWALASTGQIHIALLFGYLAFTSYQALAATTGGGFGGGNWRGGRGW